MSQVNLMLVWSEGKESVEIHTDIDHRYILCYRYCQRYTFKKCMHQSLILIVNKKKNNIKK